MVDWVRQTVVGRVLLTVVPRVAGFILTEVLLDVGLEVKAERVPVVLWLEPVSARVGLTAVVTVMVARTVRLRGVVVRIVDQLRPLPNLV